MLVGASSLACQDEVKQKQKVRKYYNLHANHNRAEQGNG
jgi:hypothetical protein